MPVKFNISKHGAIFDKKPTMQLKISQLKVNIFSFNSKLCFHSHSHLITNVISDGIIVVYMQNSSTKSVFIKFNYLRFKTFFFNFDRTTFSCTTLQCIKKRCINSEFYLVQSVHDKKK